MVSNTFGRSLRKDFLLDPNYTPLNHGSYGCYPRVVQKVLREHQEKVELFPDRRLRYDMYPELRKSRELLATLLHCNADDIVFSQNASTAANVIFRSFPFEEGDKILYFGTAYANVRSTLEFIRDHQKVELVKIDLKYPLNDACIIDLVNETLANEKSKSGKPFRMAVFDVISSLPGVLFPYEAINRICQENGILTVLDGAHSVGHIPIDLEKINPDFFFTNCHKWLFVPRGFAILYVPKRNQGSLHPNTINVAYKTHSSLDDNSSFEQEFCSPGTIDHSQYFCVEPALKYRESLGGEEAIMQYIHDLAIRGGALVADILGTQVMENDDQTLTVAMANVELPIKEDINLSDTEISSTIVKKLIYEHNTMATPYKNNGKWWIRLCAQVYLELDDFKKGGEAILQICQELNNL
ncbi:pyridoxal phosphate-dependent transferase [Halteromyces radiatus]|uniref:pyridoxal phosphate-dependent transferase n=1 Tax=Halteromyces radiatus TaxID=101107 RepID=UPI00221FEF98|nr:pyridoxal phosphate-dependent transferase [Halteromyces radiatus]KAI8092948.1 pyridoxal phosphate-dependent transferase [Halteromyces radiatus]